MEVNQTMSDNEISLEEFKRLVTFLFLTSTAKGHDKGLKVVDGEYVQYKSVNFSNKKVNIDLLYYITDSEKVGLLRAMSYHKNFRIETTKEDIINLLQEI